MTRNALLSIAVAMTAMTAAAISAEAARSVKHGAMDICQAVDGGVTTVGNGVEACCAQEVTEYDNGYIDFGEKYCVACIQGTDDCTYYEDAWRRSPKEQVNKVLMQMQKQAPVTGN
jgi:hypothetical protein